MSRKIIPVRFFDNRGDSLFDIVNINCDILESVFEQASLKIKYSIIKINSEMIVSLSLKFERF